MEVVLGTAADRKGGHIARRLSDGQLILRETAQTPPEDEESFRDYRRWRYYNTNSLWIDLEAIAERFADGGALELPVIVNRKTVDPRDKSSTPVLQLESAMGAAIGSFPGAGLLQVPRTRFVPVKTTDDLLLLRSDAYRLGDEFRVELAAGADGRQPFVALDKQYFGMIDDFEARLPAGPPSLREAERLVVNGDVSFGAGVVVRGEVEHRCPAGGPAHRRRHRADRRLTVPGVEIERKWLVTQAPAQALAAPSERIEQGYLTIGSQGAETRVRRRGRASLSHRQVRRGPGSR